jgi:antitoxin FitA
MASITVRNLEDGFKARLRVPVARHGPSMEEEVRAILRATPADEPQPAPGNLAEAIRRRFAPLGGVELEPPPREPGREPPRFEDRECSSSTRT